MVDFVMGVKINVKLEEMQQENLKIARMNKFFTKTGASGKHLQG